MRDADEPQATGQGADEDASPTQGGVDGVPVWGGDVESPQAMARNQKLLRAILDYSPAIISVKDLEGRYVLVNSRWAELLDMPFVDIIGKTASDVFPEDKAEEIEARDRSVLQSGQPSRREQSVEQKDGTHYWLSNEFPLFDDDNSPFALCSIVTDVSEERRTQIALTAALERSEALRRQVDQMHREQAAFLRHELANMLVPVRGYVELLALDSETFPEIQKNYLKALDDNTRQMVTLIDSLRKLQQFERGDYELERSPASLNNLVARVVADMQLVWNEKVEIQYADEACPLKVEVDIELLNGVFRNLIKNAAEHVMDSDEDSVRLVQVTLNEVAGKAVVTVHNGGSSVPPEDLASFFEKFNTKRKKGGTGLGTTYAYLVTSAHGGHISVTSTPLEGTTLTVSLDVAAAQGADARE
jgi:PAS domain S-box-containing protein